MQTRPYNLCHHDDLREQLGGKNLAGTLHAKTKDKTYYSKYVQQRQCDIETQVYHRTSLSALISFYIWARGISFQNIHKHGYSTKFLRQFPVQLSWAEEGGGGGMIPSPPELNTPIFRHSPPSPPSKVPKNFLIFHQNICIILPPHSIFLPLPLSASCLDGCRVLYHVRCLYHAMM